MQDSPGIEFSTQQRVLSKRFYMVSKFCQQFVIGIVGHCFRKNGAI